MKKIIFLLIISFFIFSSCNKLKIKENYDFPDINSYEEFLKEYPEMGKNLYHESWKFKPGEYYLLSNTNVYEFPHINSKSIGYLRIHDIINIIEDVHNQHEINEVMSCWYKINYNNLEGYIFGGNIAKETFICDIDNNGINDFFQYRISRAAANWHINSMKDIIIFINGKRISTTQLNAGKNEHGFLLRYFNFCKFEQIKDEIIIKLTGAGPNSVEDYIFSIDVLGNIKLINHLKKGEFFENGKWIEYE
jgi:hypothetical protein